VLTPANETELSAMVVEASGPLWITGGGTCGMAAPAGAEVMSTAGLSGISLYEPGALTVVAAAGTPLAEVEAALAKENQRLPFEPRDLRKLLATDGEATIGGVVATNASGPRRMQAGACRDSLIGVRFVDGSGTAIKNGGRVMKNVTGYDLVKLMAGSYGTLGVLSEVSFKVLPGVAARSCVMLDGLSDAQAVEAMCVAMGSPYEVTGAVHLPHGADGAPVTMLRLEGFAESVSYRTGKLREILAAFGAARVETDPEAVQRSWQEVRDVEAFAGRDGDVWRVSVKPTDAPGIAARIKGEVIFDWAGGLIWALMPEGTDLRARLGNFAGHATRVRGEGGGARFQPEAAPVAALAAALRGKFDPRGILNTGLMG